MARNSNYLDLEYDAHKKDILGLSGLKQPKLTDTHREIFVRMRKNQERR